MLTLEQIDVYYGNIQALWKVSLGVEGGKIITIVGSNGAGKSTILRSITGLIKPRRGSITFDSRRIDGSTKPLSLNETTAPTPVCPHCG